MEKWFKQMAVVCISMSTITLLLFKHAVPDQTSTVWAVYLEEWVTSWMLLVSENVCACVCVDVYTPTYTHTYEHTYKHIYIHAYIHTYTHTHTHIHIHTHTYIHTHAYIIIYRPQWLNGHLIGHKAGRF